MIIKPSSNQGSILVICSGGMDSVTLAHWAHRYGTLAGLLAFDYGQRHVKELTFAAATAHRLGVQCDTIELHSLTRHLSGSALTGAVKVPDGHYAAETMKATIVPNRNAIMLSIAFGIANARGIEGVGYAAHGGDHHIYPDCRPKFADAFQRMQYAALEGVGKVELLRPFIYDTKAEIAKFGTAALKVDYAQTWSCYKGGDNHCGRCGTCVERAEAFHIAGVPDPTRYDDPDFWRSQVAA